MENNIQYNNARIVFENKVFPERADKLEVEVSLGNSRGRMLIDRKDIFLIELPDSQLKPRIIKKIGSVKITDFAGKAIDYGFLSPLDTIEVGANSQMNISFNSVPALRIGANTKFRVGLMEYDFKLTDPNVDETQEQPEQSDAIEEMKNEEMIFELKYGEFWGIFDDANNQFINGFIIDCNDAQFYIKSPKFYIKYSVDKDQTILTVFPISGRIIIDVKKMDKKFLVREGKFMTIYNGERATKPTIYSQSPEMTRIFQIFEKGNF
ncbi:MAG TPA: hypothetical protein PLJ38_02015 [bacterium]|nr:hypothetical protein [bacterium]